MTFYNIMRQHLDYYHDIIFRLKLPSYALGCVYEMSAWQIQTHLLIIAVKLLPFKNPVCFGGGGGGELKVRENCYFVREF